MNITRYDPWSILTNDGLLNRFRNQMNMMLGDEWPMIEDENTDIMTSRWSPSVDIKEDDKKYTFIADIPGVDPDKIEVTAENGMLTIKGEREQEKKEEKKDYKRVERSWGSFSRRFSLPNDADAEKISARSRNGVLELTIPKSKGQKSRKISIKHEA